MTAINPTADHQDAGQTQAPRPGEGVDVAPPDRRFWLPLILIFLALVATIIGTGYGYYRWQRDRFVQMAHDQLLATVDAKSGELARWYQERNLQVRSIAGTPMIVARIRQFLADPADDGARQDVTTWLATLETGHTFETIALFDGKGTLRLVVPAEPPVPGGMSEHAAAALKARDLVAVDIHRLPDGDQIRLAFAMPIGLPSDADTPPDGALVLMIDPARFVYPLIQHWPTPSPTAETLLARSEGGEVLYLNELRHRSNTALKLRLPIEPGSQLPPAMAIKGREGLAEGVDYRGVPVLSAMRGVPGTPWFMVAKVDRDEIFAPLRGRAWHLALIMAALILAAGLGVGWIWYWSNAEFLRRRREGNQDREALASRIRFLNQQANDIFILVDDQGHIIDANNRALEAYGYSLEELVKRTLYELCAPESTAEFAQLAGALDTGDGAIFEATHQRRDGSTFPVETSMRSFVLAGVKYQQHIIRDITRRRKVELKQAELRSYLENLFNSANSPIIVWDPDRIINRFNHASERLSGYAAAEAIGRDLAFLFPPASREDALKRIAATNDSEHQEPAEIPILRQDGQVRLILWNSARIYGSDLKTQLGTIAQGQDITERKRMEAALHQSEEQFRALAKTSPVGIFRTNPQGLVNYWNQRLCGLTGLTDELAQGRNWTQSVHPDDRQRVSEEWDRRMQTRSPFKQKFRVIHELGAVTMAIGEAEAMVDPSGRVTGYVGTITDITNLGDITYLPSTEKISPRITQ